MKIATLFCMVFTLVSLPLLGQIGEWGCYTGGQVFGFDNLEATPSSAAIDGNHAVVASEDGRVTIFVRVGGVWLKWLTLYHNTPGGPIHVALKGNRLDVGMPGIVYHWVLDFNASRSPDDEPSAMTETTTYGLQTRTEVVYENIVALSDDGVWSAIGAPYWSSCGGGSTTNGGAVLLSKLGQQAQIVCPLVPTKNAHFGQSVSFSGDRLHVGSPGTEQVYSYEESPVDDLWALSPPTLAEKGMSGLLSVGLQDFGMQVAATATHLIVGAPGVASGSGELVLLSELYSGMLELQLSIPQVGDLLGNTQIGVVPGPEGAIVLAGTPERDFSRGGLFGWACSADECGAGEEILFPFPLNPDDECGYALAVDGESFITTCKSRVNDSDSSRGVVCFGTLPPAPGTLLFTDGFESGDISLWSTTEE